MNFAEHALQHNNQIYHRNPSKHQILSAVQNNVYVTHYFPLFDIVEKNKVAEHGDEAEQSKTSNNIDNCVLQIKFACNNVDHSMKILSAFLNTCSALDYDDKLDTESFVKSSPSLLVEVGVSEVPTERI